MSVNTPPTTWRDASGFGEYGGTDPSNIVDTAANNLVDTLGNQIVDTGVTVSTIPATVWTEDDSV